MEQAIPAPTLRRYTPEEYRQICERTDQRLDYWEGIVTDQAGSPIQFDPLGEVLDMAGAQPEHGLIAMNIGGELRGRLKGGPCQVLDASIQVRLGRTDRHAHPDVTVCCDELQMDDDSPGGPAILNPKIVFEVLSPSTESYDRKRKTEGYRQIDALQEYVLVDQDEPRVETYYRSADGVWSFGPTVTDMAGSVHLRSIGVDLPMAEVYARIKFPAVSPFAAIPVTGTIGSPEEPAHEKPTSTGRARPAVARRRRPRHAAGGEAAAPDR
jgi:Uma2 family endonuclease